VICPFNPGKRGGSLNICRNETFGVALQALNYFTNCRIGEYNPVRLVGSAYPEFDHIGTKLAVVTVLRLTCSK